MQTVSHSHFLATLAPVGLIAGTALAALVGLAMPAFAHGGTGSSSHSSSSSSSSSTSTATTKAPDLTTCPTGQVWDAKNQKCLVKKTGILPDPELTEYAFALAKATRYQEAIEVLDLLQNSDTPRALNYRGFATRKLGRTEEGIGYYLRSVAMDPTYAQVREYLGEAYVTLGKFDQADEQLKVIKTICGTECEPYEDLDDAIKTAKGL